MYFYIYVTVGHVFLRLALTGSHLYSSDLCVKSVSPPGDLPLCLEAK